MRGGEIKDPRWLTVGDEPEDTLSEEGRRVLLDLHEWATLAFERLMDVSVKAKQSGFGWDDIAQAAEVAARNAEQIVVQIEQAADYWEVNL